MRTCAYAECGVEFIPKTHNQRYHTPECCRRATNERIMENYYARKERRQGRVRVCVNKCGTALSRYNDSRVCAKCQSSETNTSRNELIRLLNGS